METQRQWSFDPVTVKKIWHGIAIALGGALITWLGANTDTVAELFKAHPSVAILATSLCSILVNVGREWLKGDNQPLP